MDLSLGWRGGPRLASLVALLLVGGALSCFTGDLLAQQPCESDDDCNPAGDALGRKLRCSFNICDYTPRCGDGVVDGDEACDDGNQDDTDECLATCKAASCGDGVVQVVEECDDGNEVNTDDCVDDCSKARCGDGVTHAGKEACDDGNTSDLDTCRNDCTLARCGDGFVQVGVEACDDGNADETDVCLGSCELARCGDGFVQLGVEACDDGNQDDLDSCLGDCRDNVCGDGLVDRSKEGCDDQNEDNNDGCADTCRLVAMGLGSGPNAQFVCAIRQGELRCWGGNSSGQLFLGSQANLGDEPGELPGGLKDLPVTEGGTRRVDQVVTGESHVCVLRVNGEVMCWGNNKEHQFGNGDEPTLFGLEPGDLPRPLTPIGGPAIDLAAGDTHTCALRQGGEVLCWGGAEEGEEKFGHLGLPGLTSAESPMLVDVGGPAVQIAAGFKHTCALLEGGALRCWGHNDVGQLGYADTQDVGFAESPVSKPPVQVGGVVVQVAVGKKHTCVVLDDGAVRCWGDAEFGRLGYMNTDSIGDNEHPETAGDVKMLAPGERAKKLALAEHFTCALLVGGAVRCWGLGGYLGLGTTEYHGDAPGPLPPPIELAGAALDLVAGQASACALIDGGEVQCWGFNGAGNHGLNNTEIIGDAPGEMVPPRFALIYANPINP